MSDNQMTEFVEKMHQFLLHQIENNNQLSEAAQESLTVAAECIEQAYKIQKKPASNQLFDIYKNSLINTSNNNSNNAGANANPAQFIQNLASTILSSAVTGSATATSTSPTSSAPPPTPKVRKVASENEKLAAEDFKNRGNDLMKQDKYKEAYDCYTKAIDLDNNNAIYYSNRAAASSKLGDNHAALVDCQEAVAIDPTYSKAYGRMGLAYASLEDHQKAKESYVKAVELDPHNESYRNNLKIAEEKLAESSAAGGAQNNMMSMLRSMMSNPEVMSMAMRSLQDPRLQNLLGMAGGAANTNPAPQNQSTTNSTPSTTTPTTESTESRPQATNSTPQNAQQQQQQQPAPDANFAPAAGFDILGAGQSFLSTLEQNSPHLVNDMRRLMNQWAFPNQNQNNNNSQDRNPPPGYS